MASQSRDSKSSIKKKSNSKSKSPSRDAASLAPSTPSAVKTEPSSIKEGVDSNAETAFTSSSQGKSDIVGIEPLPQVPSAAPDKAPSTSTTTDEGTLSTNKAPSTAKPPARTGSETPGTVTLPESDATPKSNRPKQAIAKTSHTPKKDGRGPQPRGGHHGSRLQRGAMKFGERPSLVRDSIQSESSHHPNDSEDHFDPSGYEKMTAVYFHKHNDLSRSARGVGYTPDQAVPKYGPGVTDEAESLYGPCRLLRDFQYSTWTETVVPLRNHNVVQGFNEMILFLIKLAADPDGAVNHEEAFMATSFLANIRNDLGEHPPNVLALLEYIDYKTIDDGAEPAVPDIEVITPCQAAERY